MSIFGVRLSACYEEALQCAVEGSYQASRRSSKSCVKLGKVACEVGRGCAPERLLSQACASRLWQGARAMVACQLCQLVFL